MKNQSSLASAIIKSVFVTSFILLNANAFAQDTLKAHATVEASTPVNLNQKNMWYYFKLSDTIAVKVIDHLPVPASLGMRSGSMTIVETQRGDIFRIIDPASNLNHFRKGQTIKVAPAAKPEISQATAFNMNEDAGAPKRNSFDLGVRKTTWGNILVN